MNIKVGKNLINKKINVVIILIFLLLLVIAIPTFCMLLTKDNSNEVNYWDGTVAASYSSGDGTETNPFIISNPEELALLSQEVNNGNTYDGKYFKLANNIHLNNGVMEYEDNKILYTKDSIEYYIKPFTNEYYKEKDFTTKIGTINIFPEMKLFRGNIDGNDKFIYGLYLTSEEDKTVSLFEEVNNGKINNLYFSNTIIYGNYSASLINTTQNGTYNNLIFNGYIHSTGIDTTKSYNLNNIEMNENSKIVDLTIDSLPEERYISKISLKGTTNSAAITINNNLIEESDFELEFTEIPEKLTIQTDTLGVVLNNLIFEVSYNNDSISSLISNLNNSRINNVLIRGNITGKYVAAPLIGYATNNIEINNSFNDAIVNGKYITSGFIGVIENASINMGSVYNSGSVNGEVYGGGIFGAIYSSYNINIHDSFNSGKITATTKGGIAATSATNIINHNNYYTNEGISSVGNNANEAGTYISNSNLLNENFLTTTLKFTNNTWKVSNNEFPKLITFDNESPTITINLLNNTWTDINTNEIKIKETSWINLEYEDLQSDILKVEYYIGEKIYNEEEINNLEFNLYEENIILNENGKYYIIFKVTDVVGNIKIATTDLITVDGYNLVISDISNNNLDEYNNQISTSSSIKYNFSRTFKMETFIYNEDLKYFLASDILLPNKTEIKLIDNINNKIYSYIVDNNVIEYNDLYLYELSLFKEIGLITEIYFDNKVINYYRNNKLVENVSFILDFKNANIDNNKNIEIDLVTLHNETIYSSTFLNQSKKFTLVKYDDNNKEINYKPQLISKYDGYINLSEIRSYEINLNNTILISKLNDIKVYDSEFDINNTYLELKITDSKNEIVKGNLVNGIEIEYNDKKYYSNDSGTIKIPINSEDIILKLNTDYIIRDINNGIYYLNINSCINNTNCSNKEQIPINIQNNISNIDCDFMVNMNEKDRLIIRNNNQTLNEKESIDLNIEYKGELSNPNVRVKLYKKLNFDSINQVYELVDLSQYISNNLEIIQDYEYYLIKNIDNKNKISLNLLINNYQYGGYKFEFNLYDGDSFIQKDVKNILVK